MMSPESLFFAIRIVVALMLYGFLGLVLFGLWRDIKASTSQPAEAPVAHLVIGEGQQQFKLRTSSEIGRAAGNLIRIEDETVSARHARLLYHGGQWWIEDLASRNGTELNGIPVDEPLVVSYGDTIQLGRVVARLEPGSGIEGSVETETISQAE